MILRRIVTAGDLERSQKPSNDGGLDEMLLYWFVMSSITACVTNYPLRLATHTDNLITFEFSISDLRQLSRPEFFSNWKPPGEIG